jgi:hypothetical protein
MTARWPSWAPVAVVLAAIGCFVFENRSGRLPTDDAYIFYRYAQHFAEGHGLVYNIGERVEGFTSLLWTLLIAEGISYGGDAVAIGHWLGVGSGALLLWLTYEYASFGLAGRERVVAAFSTWLLCLSTPFALWSTSGLETPLFAAAATAALIAESRGAPRLALGALIAAVLLRPEGVLLGGVVFGFLFARGKPARKTTLALLAGYLATLALLTVFRLAYFGAALPNTFYAKVGGAATWWLTVYVVTFALRTLVPMAWPIVYAWRDAYLKPGLCWCGCVLAFVVAVGGDAFAHGRFFVPAMPVLCALVFRGAIEASRRERGPAARFAMLSVLVCGVWFAFGTTVGVSAMGAAALLSFTWRGRIARAAGLAGSMALLATGIVVHWRDEPERLRDPALIFARRITGSTRWHELAEARAGWQFSAGLGRTSAEEIDARPPDDKLVAALGIGSFGFHSSARVLDILGLVDPTIARSDARTRAYYAEVAFPGHQRANTRYVLSRNPDYILIPKRSEEVFRLPAVVELWNDPEFQRRYRWDAKVGGYRRM